MEFGFTTAAYVVAAILFILSLGGLSGQESAKRAVWYGIAGMALAVAATAIPHAAASAAPAALVHRRSPDDASCCIDRATPVRARE